jgi:aspartate 1-decarboxylase
MIVSALKSKIHRAVVTQVDLNYIGSISIDESLMEQSGLFEFEKVDVLNITNGNRIQTYVIKAEKNSGTIGINGAAAHLINKNDLVIIVSYCQIHKDEIMLLRPKIIHVDSSNSPIFLDK